MNHLGTVKHNNMLTSAEQISHKKLTKTKTWQKITLHGLLVITHYLNIIVIILMPRSNYYQQLFLNASLYTFWHLFLLRLLHLMLIL